MIEALLRLVAERDCYEAIWWNESLEFFVECNDVFIWGCSDCEPITDTTLAAFAAALNDAGGGDGPTLYCARQRQMRPQGAIYKYLDEKHWPLFDACGPVREVGFGNPKPQPVPGPM